MGSWRWKKRLRVVGALPPHSHHLIHSLATTAQQEAQRAQFLVEKAKQEQRQKIVQAEGEAEAAKMISLCRRELGLASGTPCFPSPSWAD